MEDVTKCLLCTVDKKTRCITHVELTIGKYKFLLICDESTPEGTLILKNPETGTEMGRITGIKRDGKGAIYEMEE